MPAAEMISGTIIGEIRSAMIVPRNGTCGWLSPIAASVPIDVAISVANGAMMNEFCRASCQSLLLQKSR